MSSNKAIVILGPRDAQVIECPVPELREDYLLVKTRAVAANPHDWRVVDFMGEVGCRLGCDYSGIVEEVGSQVTKDFKKGDRICGICYGGNALSPSDGAYGEHITAKGDLQIKIPPNLSFEEAATLGVGVTTVGIALYQVLELPLPPSTASKSFPILIYGGSTATGALAIQFAKLSGCKVLTTCSPHNFEYVKSLGADAVFDYSSPNCAKDIKDFTDNELTYVLDCIAERGAAEICLAAMSDTINGRYASIGPVPAEKVAALNPKVQHTFVMGQRAFGHEIYMGGRTLPADLEALRFGKNFWDLTGRLLGEGKIRVHKFSVDEGGKGLDGILHGLKLLKERKVSAGKLVYTI